MADQLPDGQGDCCFQPKSIHAPCGHRDPQPGPSPAPCSLEDSTLLQAVSAPIPHGCVVHSLNGPVNGLEDILFRALWGKGVGS